MKVISPIRDSLRAFRGRAMQRGLQRLLIGPGFIGRFLLPQAAATVCDPSVQAAIISVALPTLISTGCARLESEIWNHGI